jgi:hypothetical protein
MKKKVMAFANKKAIQVNVFTIMLIAAFIALSSNIYSVEKFVEDDVLLYSLAARSGITNEWRLYQSVAKRSLWVPDEQELPPLSFAKALAIGRKAGDPQDKLESIGIYNIPGAEHLPPFDRVYYYRCIFRIGHFERRCCIILMDGSILEPKPLPLEKP